MRAVKFTQKQLDDGVRVRAKKLISLGIPGSGYFIPAEREGRLLGITFGRPDVEFVRSPDVFRVLILCNWREIELVQ